MSESARTVLKRIAENRRALANARAPITRRMKLMSRGYRGRGISVSTRVALWHCATRKFPIPSSLERSVVLSEDPVLRDELILRFTEAYGARTAFWAAGARACAAGEPLPPDVPAPCTTVRLWTLVCSLLTIANVCSYVLQGRLSPLQLPHAIQAALGGRLGLDRAGSLVARPAKRVACCRPAVSDGLRNWMNLFTMWVPRKYREPLRGDLWEDCCELQDLGRGQCAMIVHIIWQTILALFSITSGQVGRWAQCLFFWLLGVSSSS